MPAGKPYLLHFVAGGNDPLRYFDSACSASAISTFFTVIRITTGQQAAAVSLKTLSKALFLFVCLYFILWPH